MAAQEEVNTASSATSYAAPATATLLRNLSEHDNFTRNQEVKPCD